MVETNRMLIQQNTMKKKTEEVMRRSDGWSWVNPFESGTAQTPHDSHVSKYSRKTATHSLVSPRGMATAKTPRMHNAFPIADSEDIARTRRKQQQETLRHVLLA